MRVAAGAVAVILARELGNLLAWRRLDANRPAPGPGQLGLGGNHPQPFWSPDAAAARWEVLLDQVRKAARRRARLSARRAGRPGRAIYGKLDSDLAMAMMSINAVKGVEIGDGFAAVETPGEAAHDEMRMVDGVPTFTTNHAGGVLGGISTGQDVVVRFVVKPTSSILTPRRSIDRHGAEVEVRTWALMTRVGIARCRWARRDGLRWPITCCATAPGNNHHGDQATRRLAFHPLGHGRHQALTTCVWVAASSVGAPSRCRQTGDLPDRTQILQPRPRTPWTRSSSARPGPPLRESGRQPVPDGVLSGRADPRG